MASKGFCLEHAFHYVSSVLFSTSGRVFRPRRTLVIARYATDASLTISFRVGPGFQSALECAKDERERERGERASSRQRPPFIRPGHLHAGTQPVDNAPEKQKGRAHRRSDDDERPAEQWTRSIGGDCGAHCARRRRTPAIRIGRKERSLFVPFRARRTLNLAGASLRRAVFAAALSFVCRTQLTGRGERTHRMAPTARRFYRR